MNKLESLRKSKGYTMKETASKLGMPYTTYVSYEKGDREPNSEVLIKLADFYSTTVDYILNIKNNKSHEAGKSVQIPVLGYVRAGIPIEAVEEIIDYEEISQEQARQGDFFALQIKGDSMEPRITEGDVVIVRKQETVDNGDIAVVLINGDDATIKKFYKSDAGIKLVSTNPKYDPFFFTPDEVNSLPVSIVGKVVELRAKF